MWTNEQQHAINVRNKNILVSAAAGSGKTAVLAERILDMIKKGEIRMDKLLIATFTTAAAGEIRERILKNLTSALNKNPDYGFLAEQIILFEKASIGTIHSFCQSLLRNNFYKTPLPADFKIADTAELEILKEEILSDIIEEEYTDGSYEFLSFAEGYCAGKDDSSLKQLIKNVHNYSMAVSDPIEWLENCKQRYDTENMAANEFISNGWGGEYIKTLPPLFTAYIAIYTYMIQLADETEGYEKYGAFLLTEQAKLAEVNNAIVNKGDWNSVYKAINLFSFDRLPSKAKGSDDGAKDIITSYRNNLKKIFSNLKKDVFYADADTVCADTQVAAGFAKTLCNLVIKFENEYSEAKLKKGRVDFSDLEHYTIKLLREHGDELCDKYDALMIDEFQDTNEAQAEIFRRLSNGKNLFAVGDIKQSIYRFRNAQPQLFARMDREYGENPSYGETIYLSKNFRSSGAVIDFANNIFKRVMNRWIGEVDYGERESLVRGGSIDNQGYVDINIIAKNFGDDSGITEDELMTDSIRREAMLVARRIYDIVEKEKTLIYDKSLDAMRPAEYRDITILSRKGKGVAEVFAEEMSLLGIPAYCEETGSYFSTVEITFLISLLKIIDNPLQDVEMLAVLRSPVFGFDDDELAEMRSINKECSVYDLLKKSAMPKAAQALERINSYIDMAEFSAPYDIINYILSDTGYESIVAAMPNSSVRLMNIQLLRERAASFGSDGFVSLGSFLGYVMTKSRLGEEYKTASEAGANDNTVKIMNIHKSKGLEFPIVFLVNTGGQFNKRDSCSPILYDVDLGLGLDIIDCDRRLKYPNISKQAIAQKKLWDGLSEEMRILYVALTRPVSNLYIYGSVRNTLKSAEEWDNAPADNGKVLPYIISSANSALDWIMYGNQGIGKAPVRYYSAEEVISISSDSLKVIGFENMESGKNTNRDLLDIMDKRFNYKYPYTDSVSLPSKLSVSELLDNKEYKAELIKADFSKDTAGSLSGAQRGNIIHFILQSISIDKTNTLEEVKEQINKMFENGQISADAVKAADAELIYRFFSSEQGMRMKSIAEVHREYQFVAEFDAKELTDTNADEKILLQGIIDCWFEENGEIIIYDYKTGNVDIHSKHYKAQLDLYKAALERILGKKVRECVICELD